MIQALNYTPKALADIMAYPCTRAPRTAAGFRYLAAKLAQAEVFVLSDSGQLLDRSKARPEIDGLFYKPPYSVVALEYEARPDEWGHTPFTQTRCSRRIALAWRWTDDLPWGPTPLPLRDGVVIASISWVDDHRRWMPVVCAAHIAYDEPRWDQRAPSAFQDAMVAAGRLTAANLKGRPLKTSVLPMQPEAMLMLEAQIGPAAALDMCAGDLMDEVGAYLDFCSALSCRNVRTEHQPAPDRLNRARLKRGELPLRGYHVLKLGDHDLGGAAAGSADRTSPRAHLRRGHIRRLGPDRVTWVNQTMVCGHGFVDKVYAL